MQLNPSEISELIKAKIQNLDTGAQTRTQGTVVSVTMRPQYSPLSVADQALTLFAVNRGYYDDVPVEKALAFESTLRGFVRSKYAKVHEHIETSKEMSEDDEKALAAAIEDFKKSGTF